MTVAQLIDKLKTIPKNLEVCYPNTEIDQLEPIRSIKIEIYYGTEKVVLGD